MATQPIRTPPSQQYGEAVASERAQKLVPLPQVSPTGPTAPVGPPMTPGQIPFAGPTERPNEPVTAGLPLGPGPGPEVLGPPDQSDPEAFLKAIYALHPNNDILRLLQAYQQGF